MADFGQEIDLEEDGVEVQTIIQGSQAPISGEGDLQFIVQEEVETTTDGDRFTLELDPVDDVIGLRLQQSDHGLITGSHFDWKSEDQNGCLDASFSSLQSGLSPNKRRMATTSRSLREGVPSKRKQRKNRKGSIRFVNREIPLALNGAGVAKEAAREANEASFDPEKEPRKWKKHRIRMKTIDGGKFSISMWCSGRSTITLEAIEPALHFVGL